MQIENCKLKIANWRKFLNLFNLKFEICNYQFAINKHARKNRAFTLLEIILALGLSALVLMAVGTAISLHLRLLDTGRTKVEEAQLARAILRNIAQDLRSAVPYNAAGSSGSTSGGSSGASGSSSGGSTGATTPPTSSNTPVPTAASPSLLTAAIGMNMTSQGGKSGGGTTKSGATTGGTGSTSGMGATAGKGTTSGAGATSSTGAASGAGANAGAGSQSGSSTSSTDTTDTEDRTSDVADAAPQSVPGLYGNPNQLQVDISRLPRVDQYIAISNQADSGVTNANLVSDVKNVTYFVVSGVPGPNGANITPGLFRREISRAAGVYAAQYGGQTSVATDNLTSLAPEVLEIDFLYTDGTQWLDTWDTVSYGGLPVAVQVSIVVAPLHPTNANAQPNTYRLLVSIPAAKLATSSSTSGTSSSATKSTTTAQ
jgi:hypothetical protein